MVVPIQEFFCMSNRNRGNSMVYFLIFRDFFVNLIHFLELYSSGMILPFFIFTKNGIILLISQWHKVSPLRSISCLTVLFPKHQNHNPSVGID